MIVYWGKAVGKEKIWLVSKYNNQEVQTICFTFIEAEKSFAPLTCMRAFVAFVPLKVCLHQIHRHLLLSIFSINSSCHITSILGKLVCSSPLASSVSVSESMTSASRMVDMLLIFFAQPMLCTTDVMSCFQRFRSGFQRFRSDFLVDFLHNIVHNSNAFGHYCGCVAGSTKATLSNEGVFSFLVMSTENTEVLM